MSYIIITNNERFCKREYDVIRIESSAMEVLLAARDMVHKGHILISSPNPASIRMMMSPIKSIIISSKSREMDENSLLEIEKAMERHQMVTANRGEDSANSLDYSTIDFELTLSALEEAKKILWR